MISLAKINDLNEIDNLAVLVIKDMAKSSIPQWELSYPRKEHYLNDVKQNSLYKLMKDDKIVGIITILEENDPPYKTITGWKRENSIVIHRVLVHPEYRKLGIGQKLLEFAFALGIKMKMQSIKIDTHLENYKMRKFLEKNGFVEIGYLEVIDRQAYEKVLEEKI